MKMIGLKPCQVIIAESSSRNNETLSQPGIANGVDCMPCNLYGCHRDEHSEHDFRNGPLFRGHDGFDLGNMMILFEVTNNWATIRSYYRCYVWARNETRALHMAIHKFRLAKENFAEMSIKPLFASDAKEFITEISDEGWEVKP